MIRNKTNKKTKIIHYIIVTMVIYILLGLVGPRMTWARGEREIRFVSHKNGINIRSGPASSYKISGFAENNSYFEGEKVGAWFKVSINGKPAYMSYKLTLPMEGKEVRYTKATRANIRSAKGTKGGLVKKTYQNDIHIGEKDGAWFKTYVDRKPVYIAYNLTSVEEKNFETRRVTGNSINMRSSSSLGNNIVGKLYKNKEISGVKKGNYFRFTYNDRPTYIVYKWTQPKKVKKISKEENLTMMPRTFSQDLFFFETGFKEINNLTQEKRERYAIVKADYRLEPVDGGAKLKVIPDCWVKLSNYNPKGKSVVTFNGKSYYIEPSMFNMVEINYSNSYLKNVPFKYKRYISGMQLMDNIGNNAAGTYNSVSKHINILARYKNDMRVIMHELAHGISFNSSTEKVNLHDTDQWLKIWEKEWKNSGCYGATNACEGFAESFTAYTCGSSLHYDKDLKKDKPLSYEYMKNLENTLPEY